MKYQFHFSFCSKYKTLVGLNMEHVTYHLENDETTEDIPMTVIEFGIIFAVLTFTIKHF